MEKIIQNALFIIISFLVVLNHATVNNNNPKAVLYSLKEVDTHWSSFKRSHNRQYKNNQDEVKRKSIFQSNLDKINKLNAKYLNNEITYVSGITQFTDLV
jgi:recombinational DNA repair protein RecT